MAFGIEWGNTAMPTQLLEFAKILPATASGKKLIGTILEEALVNIKRLLGFIARGRLVANYIAQQRVRIIVVRVEQVLTCRAGEIVAHEVVKHGGRLMCLRIQICRGEEIVA